MKTGSSREAVLERVSKWPQWKRDWYTYRQQEPPQKIKLEPCIFCFSNDVLLIWDASMHSVSVECQKCAANGPIGYSEKEAAAGWNRHNDKIEQNEEK